MSTSELLRTCAIGTAAGIGLALLNAPGHDVAVRAASWSPAEHEVREVIARFDAAIQARDGDGVRALFYRPQGAWAAVEAVAPRSPLADADQVGGFYPGSHEEFARLVESSGPPMRESFQHIDVRTDGLVAVVSFDYVFLAGGVPQNRGFETWQLAKTAAGWKIVSLLYSIRAP